MCKNLTTYSSKPKEKAALMEKGPDLVLISLARPLSSKWPHANALIKMHLLQKRINLTYSNLHNTSFHNLRFQPFPSRFFFFFHHQ